MSDSILRRTVIFGGAAAIALSGWLVGRTTGASASIDELTPAGANVAVDCEPTQQALVRQIEIDGEPRTVVQCVTGALATATLPALAPGIATLTPAVYQPAAPVRQVTTPAPIRTAASPVRRQATSERQAAAETEQRSWQKRALVIGGSAGAGAGIGALIGGKKGALIGAAIGGGSGTLYEVVKH